MTIKRKSKNAAQEFTAVIKTVGRVNTMYMCPHVTAKEAKDVAEQLSQFIIQDLQRLSIREQTMDLD